MRRWRAVWALLTRRFASPDCGSDITQARRQRLEEEHELQHTISRRPMVEQAAEQLRRAREERDFTQLVEETFMGGRDWHR